MAGWVLQHSKPLRVPNVTQDPRFYVAVDRRTAGHTRELLCAPLRTRHAVIGVTELRNTLQGAFTDDDLAFLDALAGSVAIALEKARLYERIRQSEAQLRAEVATLQREMVHRQRFDEIIGTSPAMAKVFALEDIPLLVSRFIQQSNGKLGKRVQGIAPHA